MWPYVTLAHRWYLIYRTNNSAIVNHSTIQDDNDVVQYSSIQPSGWVTYPITLSHLHSNTTYCQINPTISGSITIPFSGKCQLHPINLIIHLFPVILGDAVFLYGPGWSSHPSTYQVSVDNQVPTRLFLNSSLPGNSTGLSLFFDALLFSQFNLTGPSHILTIDNDNGMAQFALDYIEIVTVTPWVPPLVPVWNNWISSGQVNTMWSRSFQSLLYLWLY